MEAAMEAVKSRRMTVTAAATTFSVPRKTLDDRVKGLVNHGKKPGDSTVLTAKKKHLSFPIFSTWQSEAFR